MDKIHAFYCGKPWRDLSYTLKLKAQGKCKRCGKVPGLNHLIGHHTIELTEQNIDDPNISLNPDMIEIICDTCHNEEHRRFGYTQKVYIVYGSPLSGKNTMVNDMMRRGDIVVDLDALWQAITHRPLYDKPDNCRFNIFKVRDELIEQIKMRYGSWNDAYIIGGYPEKYERERLAQSLGAELIYCESTREECLRRLYESNKPEAWKKFIDEWWDKYN